MENLSDPREQKYRELFVKFQQRAAACKNTILTTLEKCCFLHGIYELIKSKINMGSNRVLAVGIRIKDLYGI